MFEIHLHCPPLFFFFFCFPCLISSVRKLLTLACCHPAVTALIQTIVWSAQREPCPHFFFSLSPPLRRQQRHGVTHTFHRHNRSEDEGDISHHRRHLSTRVVDIYYKRDTKVLVQCAADKSLRAAVRSASRQLSPPPTLLTC